MPATGTPVVFVHGLWLHADSWGAWVRLFNENGYVGSAPGWPGDASSVEGTRREPARVAGFGIQQVVDHYGRLIDGLDRKPVVVGHSFGGLIAQKLLDDGHAVAAVAIDPAPIKGVLFLPPSALRVASIALKNPFGRGNAVSLTPKQFRYGFANAVSEQESNELYERWTIPSPARPLFEDASAAFSLHSPAKVNTRNATRGPLLITAGGRDHTVPATISRQTANLYRRSPAVTELQSFPDRGHSLTIDKGWRDVAEAAVAWLGRQNL